MNNLSQEALYNLIYSALSFADTLFQVWLTVTFAAILAIYFTRSEISQWMRHLLIALYTGAAIVLTGRWAAGMIHVLEYQELLREAGFPPFPTPPTLGTAMGVLHFLMFVVGSLATVYFMFSFREDRVDADDS